MVSAVVPALARKPSWVPVRRAPAAQRMNPRTVTGAVDAASSSSKSEPGLLLVTAQFIKKITTHPRTTVTPMSRNNRGPFT